MASAGNKIELDENHRRVVSVLLRQVEKACEGVLEWLDREPGLLNRLRDDLSVSQRERLRELTGRLREEVYRFESEVTLSPAIQSRKRAIAALLSSTQIDLEEGKSPGLRGYGRLPEEVERELDTKLDRLLLVLEVMSTVVDRE